MARASVTHYKMPQIFPVTESRALCVRCNGYGGVAFHAGYLNIPKLLTNLNQNGRTSNFTPFLSLGCALDSVLSLTKSIFMPTIHEDRKIY